MTQISALFWPTYVSPWFPFAPFKKLNNPSKDVVCMITAFFSKGLTATLLKKRLDRKPEKSGKQETKE
ncbi:hypothetical protein MSBRW_2565 [Methanosarcina barkeri str. Wiesmoor]|uniref:Uncharacterized protein n=1 Tax=Methanosarcina barkeri str. Wiesmoor TaxID=1434109 RepID=A0A0E3QNY5_METBA|nr:hypothetical protein [Methanosarcina barkeri]AKB51818.1 hypothetical protein MSBRW_2565 [Methanosarcina barkeri str. Wiesmoor]